VIWKTKRNDKVMIDVRSNNSLKGIKRDGSEPDTI
jgi:hypothetical protein